MIPEARRGLSLKDIRHRVDCLFSNLPGCGKFTYTDKNSGLKIEHHFRGGETVGVKYLDSGTFEVLGRWDIIYRLDPSSGKIIDRYSVSKPLPYVRKVELPDWKTALSHMNMKDFNAN